MEIAALALVFYRQLSVAISFFMYDIPVDICSTPIQKAVVALNLPERKDAVLVETKCQHIYKHMQYNHYVLQPNIPSKHDMTADMDPELLFTVASSVFK